MIACFYVFTLEENVAEVVEDIEVVDQEYQGQENFEQGKLPLSCNYDAIFKYSYTQWFWKNK